MYRKKDNQQTVDDFILPFDGALAADNRWVIKAGLIPWDDIEGDYSDLFPSDTGNVAKLAISVVDGFAFMEKLSWDNFNEGMTLIEAIERYKLRHGYYPESVHVDKIYRTRDNILYCLERGIRSSGPKLGRPPKEPDPAARKQARRDALDRNLSEGKRRYGLNLIKAKLQETSETVILMNLIVMNLAHLYRSLFVFFSKIVFCAFRMIFLLPATRFLPAAA